MKWEGVAGRSLNSHAFLHKFRVESKRLKGGKNFVVFGFGKFQFRGSKNRNVCFDAGQNRNFGNFVSSVKSMGLGQGTGLCLLTV